VLGKVSVDVYKHEMKYKQFSLSDKKVIKYLIFCRSEIDMTYGVSNVIDFKTASEVSELNQELIALYSSLDNIISKAQLNDEENKLLLMLFDGYSIMDIIEMGIMERNKAYRRFHSVVDKIKKQNDIDWLQSTKNIDTSSNNKKRNFK